jgi:hypothetical protein
MNDNDKSKLKGVVIPKFSDNNFTKDKIYNIVAILGLKYIEIRTDDNVKMLIDIDDDRYEIIL